MMFDVQIRLTDRWATVATGYPTRDKAWWDVSKWRARNECHKDTDFQVIESQMTACKGCGGGTILGAAYCDGCKANGVPVTALNHEAIAEATASSDAAPVG